MDEFLLKGLAAGSAEAYDTAYNRYSAALFATALRMLESRSDAEDAVQEVFTSLVCSRNSLSDIRNIKAYLFVVLRNAVIRIRLKRQRNKTCALDEASLVTEAENSGNRDAEKLWKCVNRLPIAQREILALKINGELTFREIAHICGISANTAASRYRYALEKLRDIIGEM